MPTVSVVIPTYNNADYLAEALSSLAAQTYQDFDVLIIDDGSADATGEVVARFQADHPAISITYKEQANSGQGIARNRGLRLATGQYVLFLDSDDWLHPRTLELCINRIVQDHSDLVHFDYRYFYDDTAQVDYEVFEEFDSITTYEGEECSKLLLKRHYFTVTALYDRAFLLGNQIRYGEGYFYEDFEFWARTAVCATKVSFIHSPLYTIRRNRRSTTRSNFGSDRHAVSFLKATQASLSEVADGPTYAPYYLGAYLLKKLFLYYPERIPRRYRARLRHGFLDLLATAKYTVPTHARGARIFRSLLRSGTIEKRNYLRFGLVVWYVTSVHPRVQRLAMAARKVLGKCRRTALAMKTQGPRKFMARRSRESDYRTSLMQPLRPCSILFLGFDYRYAGNSRYLFQRVIGDPRFANHHIQFATDDPDVPAAFRLSPGSKKFCQAAGTAQTVILESWAPSFLKKRAGSQWVQLWHGTPIKRLLFDSAEPDIMRVSPKHRIKKYADIRRWDYMVADSPMGADKFSTSMLIPKEHLVISGYPRVGWLLAHRDDSRLIDELRTRIGVKPGKRIVVYAPTWRDYNFKKSGEHLSTEYVLDIEQLADRLGNEYVIIDKRHPYQQEDSPTRKGASENRAAVLRNPPLEMQELLLIADHLVSDYSSTIFDIIPLEKPFTLYVTDFAENQSARGVYEDLWKLLEPYRVDSLEAVVTSITYPKSVPNDSDLARQSSFSDSGDILLSLIGDCERSSPQ